MRAFFLDTKNIIIVVLSIALFAVTDGCGFYGNKEGVSITETTRIDTTVTKRVTRAHNDTLSKNPNKEVQKVIVDKNGKVTKVKPSFTLSKVEKEEGKKELELKKHREISILPNGIVESEILYSGELYLTDYKLTTSDTSLTRTTERERVIVQSGLFGYVGSTIGLSGSIRNLQTGLQYTHRNRWFAGVGVQYNTDPFINLYPLERVGFDFRIGFRL